jgi:FtsH-binding integral membrane protein
MNDESEAALLQRNDPDSIWSAKFNDRDIRMNFVRKVYALLGFQLLVTSIFVLLPLYNEAIVNFMRSSSGLGLLIGACIGQIVTSIALLCCCGISRKVPINYILLAIFTLCESYMVGFIASRYEPHVVVAAAFSTAGITAAISIYAWTTKKDYTICGPFLLVFLFTLCIISFWIFLFSITGVVGFKTGHMILAGIAVIIFSFYLLFDTQLIMGGKRYEIEIDDYVLGAMILYTDIITIFIYLLRIFGGK